MIKTFVPPEPVVDCTVWPCADGNNKLLIQYATWNEWYVPRELINIDQALALRASILNPAQTI